MGKEHYTSAYAKKEFLNLCHEENYSEANIKYFFKTINYADLVLKGKKRLGGYPSIVHNIKMAKWMVKSNLCVETIVCALLYDTSKFVEQEELEKQFGKDVANMLKEIKLLSKITKRKKDEQGENLNRMLLVSFKDLRIIFVKIASKLENVINAFALPESEQKRIAKYTLNFYAPLAQRLGLEKIRHQLEEYSFKILNPKKYFEIENYLKNTKEEQEHILTKVIETINSCLKKRAIIFEVKGRIKSIYSIYRKFRRGQELGKSGNKSLADQLDIYGVRIIVKKTEDCYIVKNLILKNFKVFVELTKDYITEPKPNGYRSIHVFFEFEGKTIELQIRTEEMDEHAENGSASHDLYKGLNMNSTFEKKLVWIKDLFEFKNGDVDGKDKNIFLDKTQFDLFNDYVFCFTPTDDIIKLPKDSTILDFAFHLHEDIGLKCVGAMVDDLFCTINTKLKNSTTIEIITHKKQKPTKEWLDFCRSKKAKQKIKKYLVDVVKISKKEFEKPIVVEKKYVKMVEPKNPSNIQYKFTIARCCNPLPLDVIKGNIRNDEVYIHKKNCERLRIYSQFIDLKWCDETKSKINLLVYSENRVGILADLLSIIKKQNTDVLNVTGRVVNDSNSECAFNLNSIKTKVLAKIIKQIKLVDGVTSIKIE